MIITKARLILLLLVCVNTLCYADSPIAPDSQKTPGDVLTTDPNAICVPGYTKTVRNVPKQVKDQAYRNYGIYSRQPGEYEVDHLISLELGGSNSIKNLWPESFVTHPLNAHIKDELENKLHELICSHQLPVEQAQRDIANNWIAAYEKYVGPLPGEKTEQHSQAMTQPIVSNKVAVIGTKPQENVDTSPDEAVNCPSSAPIKVSKKGIYHVVGDRDYDRTKAKNCFATPLAAEASGFRAPK
ncbi:hypothetical protein [Methylomonas sp. AM2-LC]|uniref:sunset domain-containing protein n=1 Tax=Methylomonas sp. AM2-LC TaxID=3153301 RepID=UPI003266262E